MKKVILLAVIISSLTSCLGTRGNVRVKVKDAHSDVDGRKLYNVFLSDGREFPSMYAEEVAHGLSTGTFKYDEDIK